MSELEVIDLMYRYAHLHNTYRESVLLEFSLSENNITISDLCKKHNIDPNKDFKLLELSLFALNAVIQKERYILNKKDLIMNQNLIDYFIKQIAHTTYEDGSFEICDKKFNDSVEFLNLIRNKFAHGDFKYSKDTDDIVMLVDGKDFYFPHAWLKFYNYLFLYDMDKLLTTGTCKEIIVKNYHHSWTHIDTFKAYKNLLKKMEYITFSITPKKDKKYENLEIFNIYKFMNSILFKIQTEQNYAGEIAELKHFCDDNDLNFEYKVSNIINNDTSNEKRQKLYDIYCKNDQFNLYDDGAQSHILAQQAIEVLADYDSRAYLRLGLANLAEYISTINKANMNISLADYVKINPTASLHYDKIRNIIILNKFNILFNYNMEEVYNKYLDYSLLDLSSIKEKFNIFEDLTLTKIENEQEEILKQLNKAYSSKNKIESALNEKMNIKIKYSQNKSIDNSINELSESFDELTKKIKNLEEELIKIKESRKQYEEEISKNQEYMKNKNIINHIRNSIEHGNFELTRCMVDGRGESIITFKDIYNGVVTYEASLNMQQLYTMVQGGYKIIEKMFNDIFHKEKKQVTKYLKK